MPTSAEVFLLVKKYLNMENLTVLDCSETCENAIQIQILTENKEQHQVTFVTRQFINYFQLEYQEEEKYPSFGSTLIPCYFKKGNLYIPEEFNVLIQLKSFNLDEIKLVLKTLAKCHAESIYLEEKNSGKCNLIDEYPRLQKTNKILESYLFKTLNSLIDLLPEDKLTHQEFKHNLTTIITEIINKENQFRKVLCHGYLSDDTILFKCKNEIPVECKFMNFNQQHYNLPIYDVLHFIYMVTNMEFRKEYLNELLEFYYNCLKINLYKKDLNIENILPLEQDFEASINYILPLIKLQTTCIRLVQYLKPELQKKCFEDTQLFINTFKNDEEYKQSVMSHLKDLRNIVINPGLTLEDIYRVIKNKIGDQKCSLLNYELIPIGEVSGFFGEHKKLKIKIHVNNETQTLNFFVKFTPKGEAQKSIADDCGSFYKENFFYRHFVPMVRKFGATIINECTVPCYFTRLNDVLVFEDLNICNYGILNHRQPLDFEVVEIVVKQMAKLHASSIILEEKMSEQTKTKFYLKEQYRDGLEESFFTRKENHQGGISMKISIEGIPDQIDLSPDDGSILSNGEFKKKIEKIYERVYELAKPSEEFRNTLCHGDPWVNNILVQKVDGKPTDAKLIDFQLMRYCPPAQDLLGFIYLTTNRKFRHNHLDEILEIYYKEFSRSLEINGFDPEKIYSRDVFRKSIEYMRPQAVGQTVIYYHICVTNPELMADYTADEAKMRQIFLEDRRDFVAEMYDRDPIYKERNREAIEDLRDICAKYF
ncbi:hypothetical protein ILUMI_26310 [Ignelater luminosus]|uniref:CHK kinase-like domain-containing protein n=1 Tax=Ignelater luminosus TaxID=2038154 RepID=A0A8K0FZ23_IGNLU|nr:hypothetical protein ILUMI_26310 [Ignelater luminosus]